MASGPSSSKKRDRPYVVGREGCAKLKQRLTEAKKPAVCIAEFCKEHSMASVMPSRNVDPAFSLLNVMGVGRSTVCKSIMESLLAQLVERIAHAEVQQLEALLLSTARYMDVRELRKVPFEIIRRLEAKGQSIPRAFLEQLIAHPQSDDIVSELPLHAKHQIWEEQPALFEDGVMEHVQRFVSEAKQSAKSSGQFGAPLQHRAGRRVVEPLQNILGMIGTSAKLLHTTAQLLRNCFVQPNRSRFPGLQHARDPALCTLRMELCMALHDKQSRLVGEEPMLKLARQLDAAIRSRALGKKLDDIVKVVRHLVGDAGSGGGDTGAQAGSEPRQPAVGGSSSRALTSIWSELSTLDRLNIFKDPVTDAIAPRYSSMIKRPMDLSTMKKQIRDKKYNSIVAMEEDFKLMCSNCVAYNTEASDYGKMALKFMRDGLKKFAKAAAFRNADGEEEDVAHARKPKKKSADATAAVSATFPVDVVMLLAEPRVLQLLLEHCLDTMHEATASHKLPKEHKSLRKSLRLVQIGEMSPSNLTSEKIVAVLRSQPSEGQNRVVLSLFCPLLVELFLPPDVTSGQVDPIMNKLFNINFSAVQLSLACLAQCCEKNQLKVVQKLIPILQAGEVLEKVARKRGQNFANAFVRRLLATNFAQQHWPVLSPMFAATIEKHLHDQVTFSSTKPFVKLL